MDHIIVIPPGTAMYLMMIFLAVAVIGVIMAVKNRIANNKLSNLLEGLNTNIQNLSTSINNLNGLQRL